MSNMKERTDSFNSTIWKNIDSYRYNTKRFTSNSRKHGTTATSKTKTCHSETLPYSIIVKSKENPRNSTQNGWDIMLSKKYIPTVQSD